MRLLCIGAVVSITACKFPEPPPVEEDGAAVDAPAIDSSNDAPDLDAPEIDAPIDGAPQCVASTIDCDNAAQLYTECSATGTITRQFSCPLGCAAAEEKCIEIDPRNGWANYVDMVRDRTDLPSVTFTGASLIQTGDGVVFNGPNTVTVPNFPADNNSVRVFLFGSVTISGVVDVPGSQYGLVIIANGDVTIDGTLDVSADGADNGPGSPPDAACAGTTGNPGPSPTPGAGGGGRHTNGGTGGSDGGGQAAPAVGAQHFDEDLEPLRGGCRGGAVVDLANHFSTGGGGGGVVHIVSRTQIRIVGNGKIDASGGGGGRSGDNLSGGAGGGSGGGILLEAPQVVLDGAGVVLSTKGGGGAAPGGAVTSPGADGGTDALAARGGSASGQPSGGDGGIVNTVPGSGANGTGPSINGAGGGGAAGVAGIYTASGAINPQNGAVIRSSVTVDQLRTRLVP